MPIIEYGHRPPSADAYRVGWLAPAVRARGRYRVPAPSIRHPVGGCLGRARRAGGPPPHTLLARCASGLPALLHGKCTPARMAGHRLRRGRRASARGGLVVPPGPPGQGFASWCRGRPAWSAPAGGAQIFSFLGWRAKCADSFQHLLFLLHPPPRPSLPGGERGKFLTKPLPLWYHEGAERACQPSA